MTCKVSRYQAKKEECNQYGDIRYLLGPIYWKIPPSLGGGETADVIWGKNMIRQREKEGNVKEKGRKGKKMRKGEVKD